MFEQWIMTLNIHPKDLHKFEGARGSISAGIMRDIISELLLLKNYDREQRGFVKLLK